MARDMGPIIKLSLIHIYRKTVQALGLNKLHSTVEQQDNAAIRGCLLYTSRCV